jgi:hypothetical protein
MNDNEYIVEFFQIGNSVKVSAIDPETLREVSIVGDARMSRESLTNAALQKLRYVLSKES